VKADILPVSRPQRNTPFNRKAKPMSKNVKNQNVLMGEQMTENQLDPGNAKATEFEIENSDPVKMRRILREADSDGKSKLKNPAATPIMRVHFISAIILRTSAAD
jgi:hypothetical protein